MSGGNNSAGVYSIVLYKNKNNCEKSSGGDDGNLSANSDLFYRTYATKEARDYWTAQMREFGSKVVKVWGGLLERAYFNALLALNRSPLRRESLELIVQNVTKEVRNAKMLKRKLR